MEHNQGFIHSYLTLRKAVGWIGILLPFTMLAGYLILFRGGMILDSISQYYYSGMRDVFVGEICAIALFMFFYRGYDDWDKWTSNMVALFALGVAFFPTPEKGTHNWIGTVHFISAAGFFIVLAGISLFLFTKKGSYTTTNKLARNKIYIICGLVILGCLVAIFIYLKFFFREDVRSCLVFWMETVALIAFGVSWLTKGGTFYPDSSKEN
jgi:hypothetical protein